MAGMQAVAYNIIKRQSIGFRRAVDICDVVYSPWQYSYLWDSIPDVVNRSELHVYNEAYRMAEYLILSHSVDKLPEYNVGECEGGATHYHRWDVSPSWSDPKTGSMTQYCGRIGNHLFFNGR